MRHATRRSSNIDAGLSRPLAAKEAKTLLSELKGWTMVAGKKLRKELILKDFNAAILLIGAVAGVAERENHHPDLHLTDYRRLAIELSTHSAGGLTLNDFILAEKIDALPLALKPAAHGRQAVAA